MESTKSRLMALRLKGFAENFDHRIQQALLANLSYEDFLLLLIEDQESLKNTKAYSSRLRKSNLKPHKTLENYNFNLQPSVNPKQIAELATCEFVKLKAKIVMIGISGVGKSHISNGLGLKAVEKGYTVLQFNSYELVELLLKSKKNGTYDEVVKNILKADFIIIDEMALLKYPDNGSNLLMRLLERIDENISVAFTSNRELSDWVPFFADEVVASAFVDRTINDGHIIRIIGRSHRAENFIKVPEEKK